MHISKVYLHLNAATTEDDLRKSEYIVYRERVIKGYTWCL